jgi:hypothetical protein
MLFVAWTSISLSIETHYAKLLLQEQLTLDDILELKIFSSNGYKFMIHVICFHLIFGETKFWYVEKII